MVVRGGLPDLRHEGRRVGQFQRLLALMGDQIGHFSGDVADVALARLIRLKIGPQPGRAALDSQVVAQMKGLGKLPRECRQVEIRLGTRRHDPEWAEPIPLPAIRPAAS